MQRTDRKEIANLIIKTHDGQIFFDMSETAKIVGIHSKYIVSKLHNAGITVKPLGKKKIVSAYDIADFMCSGNIAPIDNTSRGA